VNNAQRSASTDAATVLYKHAQAEEESAKKIRLDHREADRLTADEAEVRKAETARQQARAFEAKENWQRSVLANRLDADLRRQRDAAIQRDAAWLQSEFPAHTASFQMTCYVGLSVAAKTRFETIIRKAINGMVCKRLVTVPLLWTTSDVHYMHWCVTMPPPLSGMAPVPKRVKASRNFLDVIHSVYTPAGAVEPQEALMAVFQRIIPHARAIFMDNHSPLKILHRNDYIMDKAFVYGTLLLSKWFGPDRFAQGVYGDWPPPGPPAAADPASAPTDVITIP
jgi:hypothetical protein